jgi:hypothetical protein
MVRRKSVLFLLAAALIAVLALSACSGAGVPATGGVSIDVNPTQNASSQVPVTIHPGEAVNLRLSGFPPNQTVNVQVNLPNGAGGPVVASAKTDAQGNVTIPFVMPTNLPNGQPFPTVPFSLLVATANNAVQQAINVAVPSSTP